MNTLEEKDILTKIITLLATATEKKKKDVLLMLEKKKKEEETWLSVKDVAIALHVSYPTALNLVKTGEIKSCFFANSIRRIKKTEVSKYIDKCVLAK